MSILTPVGQTLRSPWRRTDAGSARGGHTLLELSAVLLIGALALSAGLPVAQAYRDAWAVRAAREAIVGSLAQARAAAIERGRAEVHVDPATDSLWVESLGVRIASASLAREFGVDLGPDGDVRVLRFGPLGLGWVANATFVVSRGSTSSALTVSTYGRVRRW